MTTGNSVTIDVAEGETVTQTERVSVQDGGRIYKTGKGALKLDTAVVLQTNPIRLGVRQGSVNVTVGGVAPTETADDLAALAVISNAAFWVRADPAAGLVVTNGDFVAQWRDVREGAVTDPAATHAYPYAEPRWDSSQSTSPLYGKPPCLATSFGQPAVYFGGWKSSQKMWWFKPNGTECKMGGIKHAFIVQGVDKSYGFAVMARSGQNADFHVGGTSGSISGPIWVAFADDGRAMRDVSRTFLNGTLIDGPTTTPPNGVNFLLDVRFMNASANAGAFFTDRDINGRTGGDYLSEAVVFTNRISDADCELVSRYLQKLYGIAVDPQVTLDTAQGTSVECAVPGDDVYTSGLTVAGVGSMLKTGTGTLVFPHKKESFDGELCLAEGCARLRDAMKYHVNGGENVLLTGDNTIDMNLTVADGAPDEFGKRGTGELRVGRIPASVKKIRVEEGELALTAPLSTQGLARCSLVAGSGTPGSFANGDFSSMTNSYPNEGCVYVLYSSGIYGTSLGWSAWNNADWSYTPCVMIVNYDKFDGGGSGKWPCSGVEPPQSRFFIAVKGDATAESTFTISEAGCYTLKFHAQGRYSLYDGNHNHSPVAVQIGSDTNSLRTVGVVTACKEDKWREYALATGYLQSGTYVIRLATETTGKDNCTCFADFAFEQTPESDSAVAYRIPNGDFDTCDTPLTSTTFTTNLHMRGWTFNQGTFYDAYPQATHPGAGACFNDVTLRNVALASSAIYGNNRCRLALATDKGAYAETTFTPPAGTYRLRGDVRRFTGYWCSYSRNDSSPSLDLRGTPSIEASVTVDGAKTVLGNCTTLVQTDTPYVWAQAFTVDGTQPVTLRLESKGTGGGAAIDNLVLVSDDQLSDLVTDGSFTDGSSCWQYVSHTDASQPGLSYSKAERMFASQFNQDNWDTDPSSNSYYVRICQRGEIRQTLSFAKSGMYRLKFRTHSRPDGPNGGYGSGQNPIEAYLTKEGVTYAIGWQHTGNTNFIEHVMDFRVPAAGSYDLSLRGLCDGTAGRIWPSGRDQSTLLDDVSVVRLGEDVEETADLPETVAIAVDENARLRLDFLGTNKVRRLTLGGKRVTGLVSAATHPDFVQGPGTLNVERHGFYLICR